MQKAVFTYPNYGTPMGFPKLESHSGQTVTTIRELGEDECDKEVGRMFEVVFEDGYKYSVFEDELRFLE